MDEELATIKMEPLACQVGESNTSGVLERIVFYNEENSYCVGELREKNAKEGICIVGILPEVQCGETLNLVGKWIEHPHHGRQFKVRDFQATLPSSVYGIRKYLSSGLVEGIGKGYADKIVDHFGKETLKILEEDSGRLSEIPGLGKKRIRQIKNSWAEQKAVREVIMFLQIYGVTCSQCHRLVQKYGDQAQTIARHQPYRLASEIRGIGFKTADKIALNVGLANDCPERLQAGSLYALEKLESEGHTAYPSVALRRRSAKMLNVEEDNIQGNLDTLIELGKLNQAPNKGFIQYPHFTEAEQAIATSLQSIQSTPTTWPPIQIERAIDWAQGKAGFEFAPEQADALRICLNQKAAIITGGPGTGKTTILHALVSILEAKKIKLRLASPTGRAAQRMSEATGRPTQTIHRLLKFDPTMGSFFHNEEHPLKCDCLIIDEVGMLDTLLASSLLAALRPSTHLILVGDVHQLPSVGPGNILKDLIDSRRIAVCQLRYIFRQSEESAIIAAAHSILKGIEAPPSQLRKAIDTLNPEDDLHFVEAVEPDQCVEYLIELYQAFIPKHYDAHPIRDVQSLVPMHRGSIGIDQLNVTLQDVLNPNKESVKAGRYSLRIGDKVIQTKNNYEKNIFNGDLGQVSALHKEKAGTVTVRFNDGDVSFEGNELLDLQLAYTTSIHKSQGSEFPIVVLPVLKQHLIMLQRNLLYTAVTRGKQKVFIVGDREAYAIAVRNKKSQIRYTRLKEFLAQ